MKKITFLLSLLALCCALCAAPTVHADDKADAIKLVQDSAAFLKANGLEKALDALNDPKGAFVKGDLYVFAYDLSGNMMANVAKPAMVGQNVLDVPDSAGKKFRKEIIDRAQKEGSGWVDYKTLHPKTKLVEDKTTYFERADDIVLGCGIYKK